MVTGVLVVLHVAVSIVLVMFILLKSGRGGGLSDMLGGGGMGSTMSGSTIVEKNLDRLTVITGVLFAATTVLLALRLS